VLVIKILESIDFSRQVFEMLVVSEPALEVWNTLRNVNVNLIVFDNDETLSEDDTSKVVILFNLTHNVFYLDSDHDQSVLVAFFILNC
jgi:hypothetical protein